MGYTTPNIDRVAKEGVPFTDYYGQQSCTAGARRLHLRSKPAPHRSSQGWHAGRHCRASGRRRDVNERPNRLATPRVSLARIIWEIAMSSCQPCAWLR